MARALTYWDYLRLDQLLSIQGGIEGTETGQSADELHFIVVHQVFELWFKLVLREMRMGRDHLAAPRVAEAEIPHVVHHLRRVNAILALGIQQWRVVETLTPQDFLAFRDKLVPASGFQSFQWRELELLMGLAESQRLRYGKVHPLDHIVEHGKGTAAGDLARSRVESARAEVSLLAALNDWLYRTPIQGSSPTDRGDDDVVTGFLEQYLAQVEAGLNGAKQRLLAGLGEAALGEIEARIEGQRKAARSFLHAEDIEPAMRGRQRRVRAAALFIESYRELPLLAWPRVLLDVIVELEEDMVMLRHAHARMVERVIGRRVGTGGSGGVDYLDQTSQYRVFSDLWTVRTVLLARDRCPALEMPEFYGFAADP